MKIKTIHDIARFSFALYAVGNARSFYVPSRAEPTSPEGVAERNRGSRLTDTGRLEEPYPFDDRFIATHYAIFENGSMYLLGREPA